MRNRLNSQSMNRKRFVSIYERTEWTCLSVFIGCGSLLELLGLSIHKSFPHHIVYKSQLALYGFAHKCELKVFDWIDGNQCLKYECACSAAFVPRNPETLAELASKVVFRFQAQPPSKKFKRATLSTCKSKPERNCFFVRRFYEFPRTCMTSLLFARMWRFIFLLWNPRTF